MAPETSSRVQELIKGMSPEEVKELAALLGVRRGGGAKKEASPEYIAAKAEYDALVASNPEFVRQLDAAKEKMRGVRGIRKVTPGIKKYDFNRATGDVYENGVVLTNTSTTGWQSVMRGAGFTPGQVAAVSKALRLVTTPAKAVA